MNTEVVISVGMLALVPIVALVGSRIGAFLAQKRRHQ